MIVTVLARDIALLAQCATFSFYFLGSTPHIPHFFLHWEVVVPTTLKGLKCPIPQSFQCEIWTSEQKTAMLGIEITIGVRGGRPSRLEKFQGKLCFQGKR